MKFEIQNREGIPTIVYATGGSRPATPEENALWMARNLAAQDKPELDLELGWWIFYRMGQAVISDMTPVWIKSVIKEFENLPREDVLSALKEEFSDFRIGGR